MHTPCPCSVGLHPAPDGTHAPVTLPHAWMRTQWLQQGPVPEIAFAREFGAVLPHVHHVVLMQTGSHLQS